MPRRRCVHWHPGRSDASPGATPGPTFRRRQKLRASRPCGRPVPTDPRRIPKQMRPTWGAQGGGTDPLFSNSLIERWRPSEGWGASGPARPIPTWSPRVVRFSYTSCGSPCKRGLVAFPLLPLQAPAFGR